jgi:hypothetical protein
VPPLGDLGHEEHLGPGRQLQRVTRRPTGWALLAQSGLMLTAHAAVRPMASYRAVELDADSAAIGALSASFSALPLLLALASAARPTGSARRGWPSPEG